MILRRVRALVAALSLAAAAAIFQAYDGGKLEHVAHPPVAEPLPLGKVRLTGENRLTSNRDLDIRAILSWDVRKFLYNYLDTYGLDTSGCPLPEGWDSVDTKLKGHGSGHYMSALALAYAGCDDKALKDSLLVRMRTMVDCLRECQERTFVYDETLGRYREARDYAPEAELREMKGTWEAFDEYKKDYSEYGYGYLNAIPAAHCALVEMYRQYNNRDWVWAP
ncbi:MAG: glycoside hydrolase family 127 protein, partial [Bacteroidales bacterium]|nr:glycoside hydrolase family 127 protein [Bacteroidales bacterium]